MRTITVIALVFISAFSASAQTGLPFSSLDFNQQTFNHSRIRNDSNSLHKNWSVSMYSGIGAGFGFFYNGPTAFFPAAFGMQLNRRLNNNFYAFVGAAAVPAFLFTGRSFNNTDQGNNFMTTPKFNSNALGITTGIQAGLMYVNDAKTFSISGSIGVSNNSYPFYPTTQKQPAFNGKRQ